MIGKIRKDDMEDQVNLYFNRSMLGNRDSEVAMLIDDTDMVPTFMDGKEASLLSRRLCCSH